MSSVYCQSSCTPLSKPVIYCNSFRRVADVHVAVDCVLFVYDAGHHGRLSVLDRETGFSWGIRDTESGFTDTYSPWRHTMHNFWLASGQCDIIHELSHGERRRCGMAWDEAVDWVMRRSGTVVGYPPADFFTNERRGVQPFDYMSSVWRKWVADSVTYSLSLQRPYKQGD